MRTTYPASEAMLEIMPAKTMTYGRSLSFTCRPARRIRTEKSPLPSVRPMPIIATRRMPTRPFAYASQFWTMALSNIQWTCSVSERFLMTCVTIVASPVALSTPGNWNVVPPMKQVRTKRAAKSERKRTTGSGTFAAIRSRNVFLSIVEFSAMTCFPFLFSSRDAFRTRQFLGLR